MSFLEIVQENMTRYGMTIYLVLGNIGLLLNMIFFSQKTHRQNPCSLYLLASTICRLTTLNISLIPIIYALDHPDQRNTSLIYCKLQYYFRHVPNQMMRSLIILACVDRYALCSIRPRIRSFSQYWVAIRLIPAIVVMWLLVTLYIPLLQSIERGKCGMHDTVFAFIYTIYNIITTGLFPPAAMTVFSVLVVLSLMRIRARVQTTVGAGTASGVVRKRDRDLIRMSLVEVIVYLITTTPYSMVVVYLFATRTASKGLDQQKLESFISYLAQSFLLHLNNALPFWIYLFTLPSFRLEIKSLIMHAFVKVTGRPMQMREQSNSATARPPTLTRGH